MMSVHRTPGTRFLFLVSLSLACLLAACNGSPPLDSGGPYVWIDVPRDGLEVPVGQAVRIEGHAAYREGIVRVEIWVGGELHRVEENPPAEGTLAHFDQLWMPPGAGEYTVQVVAIGTDGTTSEPDHVRLRVGEEVAEVTPTPVGTAVSPTVTPTVVATVPLTPTAPPTSTPLPTSTPTPPTGHVIQFWVDAAEVQAGSCTVLHWHVENVKAVFLDGNGVAGDGSREICPCEEETHTLTVTLGDDTQEVRVLTIRVTGTCATPTPKPTSPPPATATPPPPPTPDKTPPPAPALVSPSDGETLACVSKVTLDWNPVSDPSGVAEYRVQVEQHAGDFNWQPLDDSPWTGLSATELEIDVECGRTYRWRVRAVDSLGNVGSFSGWFEFILPLL